MPSSKKDTVLRWLLRDARRHIHPGEFLEAFAKELRRADVDVSRITTGVPVLHPQIFSFSGLWELGKPATERLYRLGPDFSGTIGNSPIGLAYQGVGPIHCDLSTPPKPDEFAILPDLRKDGYTDYVVCPVPFSDDSCKALSFATKRDGGFNSDELALFEELIPGFAFNLEVQTLRRTARTLLDTYVGPQSGGRVLDGQIQRGSGETIRAVIWLSDLRGFTDLSERLPRDMLIDLLNSYFGSMCDAVSSRGGEVLKFIGDALLAIFPIQEDETSACAAALTAAKDAQTALGSVNANRLRDGLAEIDYGVALHIGDVMYGNIGSDTRLDFTVIGPAVNRTSRMESLCRPLGQRLLLSSEFVKLSRVSARSLGLFSLKGIASEHEMFVPTANLGV